MKWAKNPKALLVPPLLLILVLANACGTAATPTPIPATKLAPGATAPIAAPTPVPTPVTARQPVVSRLKMSIPPPHVLATLPSRGTSTADSGILAPMFEHLITQDRFDLSLKPMLATEWEASNGFKTWRFKLQKGVKFHDGSPFTARDVVYTWEELTDKAVVTPQAPLHRLLMGSRDAFEIISDHEVVINLTRPEVNLPYYFSNDLEFMIVSKEYGDKHGREGYAASPVGTGPYRFLRFREGQDISYQRVENHWRKTAPFPELEIRFAPEDLTRLAQLLAREIHMATIPTNLNPQVTGAGLKIIRSTQPAFNVSIMLGGQYLEPERDPNAPYNNLLVRQALNLAVNKEQINQQIFGGYGDLAVVGHLSRGQTGDAYDDSWQPYPYDLPRAKKLMKDAGFPLGFKTKILVSNDRVPEKGDMAEALAIMWRQIGVEADVEVREAAFLTSQQRAHKLQGIAVVISQAGTPTFRTFPILFASNRFAGQNCFYCQPYIEENWGSFVNSIDPQERRTLLRGLGQHLYEQYANVPVVLIFSQQGVDPAVIADYKSNMLLWHGMKNTEFIEPVYKR